MSFLAYIDPGIGSFVLQLIVGLLVAVAVAFRRSRAAVMRLGQLASGRDRRNGTRARGVDSDDT